MRAGDHFRVRDEVGSDGYWNIYTVDTKFGAFQAHGWFDLRNLIREINAIAYLDEFTQTKTSIRSAADEGLQRIDVAAILDQQPVRNSSKVPRGLSGMFGRYAWRARMDEFFTPKGLKGGPEADGDPRLKEACAKGFELSRGACDKSAFKADVRRLTKKYFDVDGAERAWHERLETDPNSAGEMLQSVTSELSQGAGVGPMDADYAPPNPPKDLGITRRALRLTWSQDPYQLHKYVFDELRSMGIEDRRVRYFLGDPYLSPTKQVSIVESLGDLKGVQGTESVMAWAADNRSEDEALYATVTVALIAWYHGRSPLARFMPDTVLPVAETANGRVAVLLPVDHLSWTEEAATIFQSVLGREEMERIADREIWLTGRASERARAELEARGWRVRDNGIQQVLAE